MPSVENFAKCALTYMIEEIQLFNNVYQLFRLSGELFAVCFYGTECFALKWRVICAYCKVNILIRHSWRCGSACFGDKCGKTVCERDRYIFSDRWKYGYAVFTAKLFTVSIQRRSICSVAAYFHSRILRYLMLGAQDIAWKDLVIRCYFFIWCKSWCLL